MISRHKLACLVALFMLLVAVCPGNAADLVKASFDDGVAAGVSGKALKCDGKRKASVGAPDVARIMAEELGRLVFIYEKLFLDRRTVLDRHALVAERPFGANGYAMSAANTDFLSSLNGLRKSVSISHPDKSGRTFQGTETVFFTLAFINAKHLHLPLSALSFFG